MQGAGGRKQIIQEQIADFGINQDALAPQEGFHRVVPLKNENGAVALFRQAKTRVRYRDQEISNPGLSRGSTKNPWGGENRIDLLKNLTNFSLEHDDDQNKGRGPNTAQHPGG